MRSGSGKERGLIDISYTKGRIKRLCAFWARGISTDYVVGGK